MGGKEKRWFLLFFAGWWMTVFTLGAQAISGTLKDNNNAPLSYANVVVMTTDSFFVDGGVSDKDGGFLIPVPSDDNYLLKISSVGFQTVFRNCTIGSLGVIVIPEQSLVLGEAVVIAHRPVYELKNGKLITNVQNSLLSKIGTASDVLNHIPGVQGKDGAYSVFGKGTPSIYLNGRLVRDLSELERLGSENIARVEVLNNPGVQYDASVKAVIRIRTARPVGEGLGLDVRSRVEQSHKSGLMEQFNLKYSKNGLDLFGGFAYTLRNFYQESTLEQITCLDTLWRQNYTFDTDYKRHIYDGNIGINNQFNERHSAGVRYSINAMPKNSKVSFVRSQVYANESQYDYWENNSRTNERRGPKQQLNAYYTGMIGKLNIDFNADLLWNKDYAEDYAEESSLHFDDCAICSFSDNSVHLFAAKLILSHPLWGGDFSFGGEFASMKKNEYYKNEEAILPSTGNVAKEKTETAFLDYTRSWGNLDVSAGVRYEHVNYSFQDKFSGDSDLRRTYDNLFPFVSLSYPIGRVQSQLSYSEKIHRPDYGDLSNNIVYINRFSYKGGNPKLQPEIIHSLRLDLSYQWVQLSLDYQRFNDVILNVADPYDKDPRIVFVTYRNEGQLDCLNASLSLSPKIGLWEPMAYIGLRKQWFDTPWMDGFKAMNKPMLMFNFNNAFSLPKGFVVRADFSYQTKGASQNYILNQTGEIDLSLRKSFLQDRLSFNLQWFDVEHLSRQNIDLYSGINTAYQRAKLDSESVRLTVRFKFNMGRNKYKGSGAGQDVINRL